MNHWLLKSNWFDDLQDGKMEGAEFVAILFCLATGLAEFQTILGLGVVPNEYGVAWALLGTLILVVVGLAILVVIFTLINFVFATLVIWLANITNSKSLLRFSSMCGAVAGLSVALFLQMKTGSFGAAFVGAMFGFMNGFCWALAFYVGAGFLPRREVAA